MPKHKTKIDINNTLVMINMYVELEKNQRGFILKIFKMVKIEKFLFFTQIQAQALQV